MEPLNTITNHPNIFMRTITQGYLVAKGVNSPGVKVLADLYHAQIQAGTLIPTLASCWDELPYIQVGDNPGRLEPGPAEINHKPLHQQIAREECRERQSPATGSAARRVTY